LKRIEDIVGVIEKPDAEEEESETESVALFNLDA